MARRLTVSVLFVLGLFALSAVGQPPGGADQKQPLGEKVQPANPTDTAVAAALAHDPDVKVARAKVQLAEAELAKARQGVVLKVMTLMASINEHKAQVEQCRERAAWAERMVKQGVMDQRQFLEERAKLEAAQAALARLETELKLLTGGAGKELGAVEWPGGDADAVARGLAALAWYNARMGAPPVQGPVPDRIRAALDKPVKLGAKGEKFTFEKALEVFKRDAGLDVPVRGKFPTRDSIEAGKNAVQRRPIEIETEGEELPVGAWLQLFEDNAVWVPFAAGQAPEKYRFFVREYGLLIAPSHTAPPDAPSLTEFWKQKPPEKKEPAPGPKEGK